MLCQDNNIKYLKSKPTHAFHSLTQGRLTEKHSHLICIYIKNLNRNLHVVTDNNYCFAAKFSACGPHLLKAYNTVYNCASLWDLWFGLLEITYCKISTWY